MMQEWLLGVGSVLLEVIVAFQGRRPAWRSPLDVTVLFVPLFDRSLSQSHEREGVWSWFCFSGLFFDGVAKLQELRGRTNVLGSH